MLYTKKVTLSFFLIFLVLRRIFAFFVELQSKIWSLIVDEEVVLLIQSVSCDKLS